MHISIRLFKVICRKGPTAVESKIGYLLSGPLFSSHSNAEIDVLYAAVTQGDDTSFWDMDKVGTSITTHSKETSVDCIRTFIDFSVRRISDSSYIVGFPWKPDHPASTALKL